MGIYTLFDDELRISDFVQQLLFGYLLKRADVADTLICYIRLDVG